MRVIFPRRNHMRAPARPPGSWPRAPFEAAASTRPSRPARHTRWRRRDALRRPQTTRCSPAASPRQAGRPAWPCALACRCARPRACMHAACLWAPAAAQPNYSVASSFSSQRPAASGTRAYTNLGGRQGRQASTHRPPRSALLRAEPGADAVTLLCWLPGWARDL